VQGWGVWRGGVSCCQSAAETGGCIGGQSTPVYQHQPRFQNAIPHHPRPQPATPRNRRRTCRSTTTTSCCRQTRCAPAGGGPPLQCASAPPSSSRRRLAALARAPRRRLGPGLQRCGGWRASRLHMTRRLRRRRIRVSCCAGLGSVCVAEGG